MPYVTLNDYQVYYEAEGEGPPIILLHNATGSTRDWRRVAPLLAAGGYRVIMYDRRGFGRSDPLPSSQWPLDYLHDSRDELLDFMDALGLKQAALIGNSDGATIALLAAAARSESVLAIVAESPHMWYETTTLVPAFQQFEATLGAEPRFWKAVVAAHGDRAEEVITRWYQRWSDSAFYAWNERDALARVSCPVLVIHGKQDIFFPVAHSLEIVDLLPNARLFVYDDVGHVPHLEIANDYAQDILGFLKPLIPSQNQPLNG